MQEENDGNCPISAQQFGQIEVAVRQSVNGEPLGFGLFFDEKQQGNAPAIGSFDE